VFVDGMNVRQRDVSRVLVNPKDEGLSGLAEIALHLLYPLARRERMKWHDVLQRRRLRLRKRREGSEQQGDDGDSHKKHQGSKLPLPGVNPRRLGGIDGPPTLRPLIIPA